MRLEPRHTFSPLHEGQCHQVVCRYANACTANTKHQTSQCLLPLQIGLAFASMCPIASPLCASASYFHPMCEYSFIHRLLMRSVSCSCAQGYAFQMEIMVKACQKGCTVGEVQLFFSFALCSGILGMLKRHFGQGMRDKHSMML